jgi:transmembrane sensor
VLTLDADTVVSPRFSGHRRLVELLRGRARFKVAHQSGRPFVVAAGATFVTAHGTVFDVDLLGRDRVDVALLQGVVDVSRARALGLLHPVSVARLAGTQTARLDGARVRVTPVSLAPPRGDWTSGQLTFDQTPLSEVLADADRYGGHKIRLASPDLGALEITGVFHAGATTEMAASLATSLGLRVSNLANGDVLLSRPSA